MMTTPKRGPGHPIQREGYCRVCGRLVPLVSWAKRGHSAAKAEAICRRDCERPEEAR
jgi:hypothetical protein